MNRKYCCGAPVIENGANLGDRMIIYSSSSRQRPQLRSRVLARVVEMERKGKQEKEKKLRKRKSSCTLASLQLHHGHEEEKEK